MSIFYKWTLRLKKIRFPLNVKRFVLTVWLTALIAGPIPYLIYGIIVDKTLHDSPLMVIKAFLFLYELILYTSLIISAPIFYILYLVCKKNGMRATDEFQAKLPVYILGAICPYIPLIIMNSDLYNLLPLSYACVIISATKFYKFPLNIDIKFGNRIDS